MRTRFLLLLLLTLASPSAFAAAPETLGVFGSWSAYKVIEEGQPLCYMSIIARPPETKPANKKAKALRRGTMTLMITHRPAENSTDVFSYAAGTKFKPASEATVRVGAKNFSLFTQGDTAWSRDAATDRALTAALRYAPTLVVSGTTTQGARIEDTVTLKGSNAAYKAISAACGIPVAEDPKPKTPAKPKKAAAPKKP